MVTRRHILSLASSWMAAGFQRGRSGRSRIHARPGPPAKALAPGEHRLGLDDDRDSVLRIPEKYRPDVPAPLVVLLHGAGGSARRFVTRIGVAESLGVVVLAPQSRGATWDAIRGDFGPDVAFIDRALASTFDRCAIDPRRVAIGGFSDGATYALSLGVDNGDLFTHVLAFSPGFITSREVHGRPQIFISHGSQDQILPIASTSRRLVPGLKQAGYEVRYREFDGPHTVPPSISLEALQWFAR